MMGTNERKRSHRRKEYLILISFFLGVGVLALFLQSKVLANRLLKAHFIAPAGVVSDVVALRLASTPAERTKGLMFEKNLGLNEGMLFVFPDEAPRSFWMKNTPLPLDMVFISGAREVIGVVSHTTPLSSQSYSVPGASQYVVELNAGRASALGISQGSKIVFEGPVPKAVVDTVGDEQTGPR